MFEWIQQLFQSISMFHVLGILFIVILILYYIYINRDPNNMDVLPTLTPLNVRKDIVTPDVAQQMIVGSGGSTVMGFFSLQAGNRTTTYNNNFVPLMQVDNNWWLEISNTNIDDVSARLRVKTSKNGTTSSTTEDEIIPLPSIPKQKWVFIAILREGRRFDVVYDNRIVASHHLNQYPVVITSPLSIGSKGLDGKVIHVIINKTRLTPSDIERQRLIYVDTNNDILEDNYLFPSFPSLKLFAECPSGLPCDPITKAPLDNMYSWTTPYA
jgi:hypothetical protein